MLLLKANCNMKYFYGEMLIKQPYQILNKIYNRALRYITKLPYRTNIDKLFANANLLKINELYKFTASKYVFKLLYNNGPKNDMQLLSETHIIIPVNQKTNVFVLNLLSSNLSKSVTCSKIWNNLLNNIKAYWIIFFPFFTKYYSI